MANNNGNGKTAIVKASDYAIMKSSEVTEIIRENMGNLEISQRDLDRAKIPSGGLAKFEVPDLGGTEMVDSITGVVIGFKDVRVYWEKSIEEGGGGSPPDCFSEDTYKGTGKPGGDCCACPFAEFGSASNGNGQACSQRRLLFVLRPNDVLPLVINLPPTSVKGCGKFFLQLGSHGIRYYEVVIEIGLEPAKNAKGVAYAKATFKMVDRLDKKTAEKFAQTQIEFAKLIERTAIDEAMQKSTEAA